MTTHYKACCKPQINARFVKQVLVEVWAQHVGFRCWGRRDEIDPKTYAPHRPKERPSIRASLAKDPFRGSRRDRDQVSIDWDSAQPLVRGKRSFGPRRSKANTR